MTTLATLQVPGPTIVELTRPFWEQAEKGRLMIQRCGGCAAAIFYPRGICPRCWSEHLAWEEASGKATLESYSEVHRPGHPGWIAAVPYVVGLAALSEGPVMTSLVLPGKRPVSVGDALVFDATSIGGRRLPAFRAQHETEAFST